MPRNFPRNQIIGLLVVQCVHPGVSTDCPAEVSLAGAQAARPRLGAGATKRLREERRRRRRESSYAVLAASKGVSRLSHPQGEGNTALLTSGLK